MAKFTAADARKIVAESQPESMEDGDEYFAGVLRDIEETAKNGDMSLLLVEPLDELTVAHVIELYSRGFQLNMVDAMRDDVMSDVMISWEAE